MPEPEQAPCTYDEFDPNVGEDSADFEVEETNAKEVKE